MSQLQVGIIGCGGFARGMHIPLMKNNPKYNIRGVMDTCEAPAQTACGEAGAEYFTTDAERILSDPQIDVVLITTPHDTHAKLSIMAADAGKHILCEKPMGLNLEECKSIVQAVKKSGVKYTVGYNRGMAPLVVKAKNLLADLPDKKLIYHRIQAPFPADHWTHDPNVGGGRFVGEGCHIFDLLCELVDAPPVSVYASGGTFLDPREVKIPDSGIVTITFADGSVGTTLIASAGCPTFPKEATEIYCAHKAIYINDFREMVYCGFDSQDSAKYELPATDKGQNLEVDMFADAVLNNTEPPNGLVKAARAAVISFLVNESIEKGCPLPISESDYNI